MRVYYMLQQFYFFLVYSHKYIFELRLSRFLLICPSQMEVLLVLPL